jgi:Protein of unknown function (DUF3450)
MNSAQQRFERFRLPILLTLLIGPLAALGAGADSPLESAIDLHVAGQEAAVESQKRVDALADDSQAMLQEYRLVTGQLDDLKAYDDQLERLPKTQESELASFATQLESAKRTQREIVPLLGRMVETLAEFVALDLPFLPQERGKRLESLRAMLDDPAVALPDRYRRVMEAYQIETDYGRTIESYSQALVQNGVSRTVDILRIGRVALLYTTFDRTESGYWDRATGAWIKLPQDRNHAIARGIQMARKETPPDFIEVPVPAPVAP